MLVHGAYFLRRRVNSEVMYRKMRRQEDYELTTMEGLELAGLAFYVVWRTSTKFGLYAGNMTLNTQNEQWTHMRAIARNVLPVCLSIHPLRYKQEGRGFYSQWGLSDFSLTSSF